MSLASRQTTVSRFGCRVFLGWTTCLVGCLGVGAPEPQRVVGAYELATINGGTLPQPIATDGLGVYQVVRAQLVLTAEGTYVDRSWMRYVTAEAATVDSAVSHGSFLADGPELTMTPENGNAFALTVGSNGLARVIPRSHWSATLPDLVLEYQRR